MVSTASPLNHDEGVAPSPEVERDRSAGRPEVLELRGPVTGVAGEGVY
jgi:hypothetical protein